MFQVETPVVVKHKRAPNLNKKRKLLIDNEIELHSKQITQQLNDVDDILISFENFVPITLNAKKLRLIDELNIDTLLDFNNRLHIPQIYRALYTFDGNVIQNVKDSRARDETVLEHDPSIMMSETQNQVQDASFFEFGETGFGNDEPSGFGNDDKNNDINISMIHPFNVKELFIHNLYRNLIMNPDSYPMSLQSMTY